MESHAHVCSLTSTGIQSCTHSLPTTVIVDCIGLNSTAIYTRCVTIVPTTQVNLLIVTKLIYVITIIIKSQLCPIREEPVSTMRTNPNVNLVNYRGYHRLLPALNFTCNTTITSISVGARSSSSNNTVLYTCTCVCMSLCLLPLPPLPSSGVQWRGSTGWSSCVEGHSCSWLWPAPSSQSLRYCSTP